jgi:hypothetical protein
MVVDGGLLPGGLPSTLVAAEPPAAASVIGAPDVAWGGWSVEVLRAGRLSVEQLRERLRVIGAGARAGTARDAARLC